MGNIFSAINDDEEEWCDFKAAAGIANLTGSCYSRVAVHAKEGFYTHGYVSARLKLFIKHMLEIDKLKEEQNKELKEYDDYIKYKAKFQ